ncbi:hypothetical protein [Marinivivus vitaminiproducens]|uniref:hypothetical protein n=1 Tax=Marinivivus vitaminiproducens TaxID=3035935 RepID=UPI0027A5883A|nr:hypothetical protein P4R82_12165 [Geminicoccaceae bacterium SCSIO 64248]
MTHGANVVLVAGFEPEQTARIVADLRRRLAPSAPGTVVQAAESMRLENGDGAVLVRPAEYDDDAFNALRGGAVIAIDTDPDGGALAPLEAQARIEAGPRLGQRLAVAVQDALARQRARRRLLTLDLYDDRSGLATRDLLLAFLTSAFDRLEPGEAGPAVLLTAPAGDPAQFGRALRDRLPPSALVAGLEAGRLAIVFQAVADAGLLRRRAMEVIQTAARLGRRAAATRVGMALAPDDATSAADLLRAAETALGSHGRSGSRLLQAADDGMAGTGAFHR